jgi:hypothetical protein
MTPQRHPPSTPSVRRSTTGRFGAVGETAGRHGLAVSLSNRYRTQRREQSLGLMPLISRAYESFRQSVLDF